MATGVTNRVRAQERMKDNNRVYGTISPFDPNVSQRSILRIGLGHISRATSRSSSLVNLGYLALFLRIDLYTI